MAPQISPPAWGCAKPLPFVSRCCFLSSPSSLSRQIRHGVRGFHKLLEASHHGGLPEQFAEDLDLPAKLFARNRLDELLCGGPRAGIELSNLLRRRPCPAPAIPLRRQP